MPLSPEETNSILAKYGLGSAGPERTSSLWQKITQPVKTLFGATGGALPGLVLGQTDLYQEAKQRELEQLAASRGVTPEELTTAERVEALPGLGSVLTSADIFENNVLGRVAKPVVRIAGDIVGDPTSFLGGVGALSKISAIRKIAAGGEVASVLKNAGLAAETASGLDKALHTAQKVEAAGKALGEGSYFKAAWRTVKATAPQAPFGVLPAIAYGPELAGGIKQAATQTVEQAGQGEYGQAAETAAGGLGLAAMAGLIAYGVHGDWKRANAIASEAAQPVVSGAAAAAKTLGITPEEASAMGWQGQGAYQAGGTPPAPVAPMAEPIAAPAPIVAAAAEAPVPEVRSAPVYEAGTPAAAVVNPAEQAQGIPGTLDQKLADNAPAEAPTVTVPERPVIPPPAEQAIEPPAISQVTPEATLQAAPVEHLGIVGGREVVLATIDGKVIPFYRSTGSGGKLRVPAGAWYPFLGLEGSWFNKGSEDEILNFYGSPKLKLAARWLNQEFPKGSPVPPPKEFNLVDAELPDWVKSQPEAQNQALGKKKVNAVIKALGLDAPVDEDYTGIAKFIEGQAAKLRGVLENTLSETTVELTPKAKAVVEKPETPEAPAARPALEKDALAVGKAIDQAFDPTNKRVKGVAKANLEDNLGVSKKRSGQVAKVSQEFLDATTEVSGATRMLKPEVDLDAKLEEFKAKYPTEGKIFETIHSKILEKAGVTSRVEAVSTEHGQPSTAPRKPQEIDPQALRASILEGVDLGGDPNAPALVAARKRLGSLSREEQAALASLYPEKPVDLKQHSRATQSLARRLGLTQEKESFRTDGTVRRVAVEAAPAPAPAPAEPAPKAPEPVATPTPEVTQEVTPAVEPAKVVEAAPEPTLIPEGTTSGYEQTKAIVAARIQRKQSELAGLKPDTEAHQLLAASLEADTRHLNRVTEASKAFPEVSVDEGLKKLDELGQESPIRVPREVPENPPVEQKVGGEAGAFVAKTESGEPVKKTPPSPAETEYFKGVDRTNPKDAALADAVMAHSQSAEFRRKAIANGVNLDSGDATVISRMLQNIHNAIKNSPRYAEKGDENLSGVVAEAMNSLIGTSKLRSAGKALKERENAQWVAQHLFNQELGRRGTKGDLTEEGAVTHELTSGETPLNDMLKHLEETDPSGGAQVALVRDVLAKAKQPDYMVDAMRELQAEVKTYRSGKWGGNSDTTKIKEFLQGIGKGDTDPRKFLRQVSDAQSQVERAFSKEEATRVKFAYDGQKDSNDIIKGRVEQLKTTLKAITSGEDFDYQDLWRQITRLHDDVQGVAQYLKANGKSRELKPRLSSLGVLPEVEAFLNAAKAVVSAAKPDNLADRLKSLSWDGRAANLQQTLRNALEELNPAGRDAPLDLPEGFAPGVAAKLEGKSQAAINRGALSNDLWDFYAKQNTQATALTRAMALKDPLSALGKNISEPHKEMGTTVRVFRSSEAPTTKLVLSLDNATSRPSTVEGGEIKLEETPAGGVVPKEGLPRLESYSGGTGNLAKTLGDFGVKLHQTGSDRFLVSADLPDTVSKLLDDPRTWADLPVRAERLEALDNPDRVGYRLIPNEGGGTPTTPRPTEGSPKYQAEPKVEAAGKPVTPITKASVESAFPGRKIQEGTNSYSIELPNGSTVFVEKSGFISIDPEALKAGYGPKVNPDDWLAKGSFQTIGPDGLIKIVNGEALSEEVGHAMFSLGLKKGQREQLLAKYGNEESAVKAWTEWHKGYQPAKDPTGLFARILQTFKNIYRSFKPTIDHTFEQMSSGKVWEQRANKIASGEKYSAVPKEAEAGLGEHDNLSEAEFVKAVNAGTDELARVFPTKVPKLIPPDNFKGEKLAVALDDLQSLPAITAPTKPGGGKGILDLGFNSFKNLLPDETMKHAKLLAAVAKRAKSGYRYAERPEIRTVMDSVLYGVGKVDPVEMTNRITALLNKEGRTQAMEKNFAYVQMLNNTLYHQGKALADAVLTARDRLVALRDPAGNPRKGVDEATYKSALEAYDNAVDTNKTHNLTNLIVQNADSGAGAMVGRWLRQRALVRGMLDPAAVATGRLESALKHIAGAGNADQAKLAMKKFLEEGDTSGIISLAEAASQRGWFAKFLQYIKNGMLGPSSQTSNIVGNTILSAARLTEDSVANHVVNKMLDSLAAFSGKDSIKNRKFIQPAGELMKEAAKLGNRLGFSQLKEDLASVWGLRRLRTLPHEAIDVAEFPHQMGAIEGKKGEFISIPGKMMGTMDRFFQAKIRTREMMIEAYGQAVKDGHTGEALLAESRKNFQAISDAFDMTNPNFETTLKLPWMQGAIDRITSQVAENTFQASLHGTMFEGMEKILRKHPGLQLIVPFYRTPANIFLQTLKRTPVGFFMKGSGPEGALMARDISKPLVGTSLMMLFYSLAETGDITGGGSIDPEMRENQKQTGWLPYSVRMGDKWYTYNRLEPVSSLVGIAADLHEAVRRGDIHNASSLMSRGIQIVQNNLTNKTFLSGVSNFMTAYSDPERYGERLAKGLTGMLVPNTLGPIPVGALARAADPVYRQTDVLTEPLSKIPGVSEGFPAQATAMGEERQRPGSFLTRLAFPGQVSDVKTDKGASVADELDRIGIAIRAPKRTERMYGASVEYTPQEFELMKKAHRDATSEVYARLKSGGLRGYPDNEDDPRYVPGGQTKKEIIRGIFEKHRNRARAQISPAIQRRARGLLRQRQQEALNNA